MLYAASNTMAIGSPLGPCCQEARTIHGICVKDKILISVVDELLDEFNGSGYSNVFMHMPDIEKTVFQMHHGHST
ncbi:hypothetical protein ACQJBY_063996 [Aegilops geniculata]